MLRQCLISGEIRVHDQENDIALLEHQDSFEINEDKIVKENLWLKIDLFQEKSNGCLDPIGYCLMQLATENVVQIGVHKAKLTSSKKSKKSKSKSAKPLNAQLVFEVNFGTSLQDFEFPQSKLKGINLKLQKLSSYDSKYSVYSEV